jgi:hypothetical protein
MSFAWFIQVMLIRVQLGWLGNLQTAALPLLHLIRDLESFEIPLFWREIRRGKRSSIAPWHGVDWFDDPASFQGWPGLDRKPLEGSCVRGKILRIVQGPCQPWVDQKMKRAVSCLSRLILAYPWNFFKKKKAAKSHRWIAFEGKMVFFYGINLSL